MKEKVVLKRLFKKKSNNSDKFLSSTVSNLSEPGMSTKDLGYKLDRWWREHKNDLVEIETDLDSFLDLLYLVNKEVKSSGCPNNLRNKFYKYKSKFIKYMLRSGKVLEIWDSGDLYKFKLKEGCSFHQLKELYKDYSLDIIGEEEYIRDTKVLPEFSLEDYKTCLLSLYNFLPWA